MEPNKLENQIREKLNSREIKPTQMAWDRLDAMLTVSEKKKSKIGFGWLFIAASLVVIITIASFHFNTNATPIKSDITVVSTKNNTDTIQNINIEKSNIITPTRTNDKIVLTNHKFNQNMVNKKSFKVNSIINQNQEVIASVLTKKQPDVEIQKEQKSININPDALLSEGNQSNLNQDQVLLTPKSTIKVDANSLLSQVSNEINQNYRESKFEKLKRNFKTVKVAVINRNNQ